MMSTKSVKDTISTAPLLIATLFSDGGALQKKSINTQTLHDAKEALVGTGLMLVETERDVALRTTAECAEAILQARTEELEKNIGPAGLEIISIVLYSENVTRSAIDYIRGVNSAGSLRTLLARGLLTREKGSGVARFVYKPTTELLAHLGVSCAQELPAYDDIRTSLRAFLETREEGAQD